MSKHNNNDSNTTINNNSNSITTTTTTANYYYYYYEIHFIKTAIIVLHLKMTLYSSSLHSDITVWGEAGEWGCAASPVHQVAVRR